MDNVIKALEDQKRIHEAEITKIDAALRAYHGAASEIPNAQKQSTPVKKAKKVYRGALSMTNLALDILSRNDVVSAKRIDDYARSKRDVFNSNSVHSALSALKRDGYAEQRQDGRWSITDAGREALIPIDE